MQSLDIISVNIWLIIISLCNLVILFLILKRFLFKPVKRVMAERQAAVDNKFAEADRKLADAESAKKQYEVLLENADAKAGEIVSEARQTAKKQGDVIVDDARRRAEVIVRNAEADAEKHLRDADDRIREEIASVSLEIAEKMVGRVISEEDRKRLADEFISSVGEENE